MGAQINNISTYNFQYSTNQTFLAGSLQIAPMETSPEILTGNEPTGSQPEISALKFFATGKSQEVTQQISTKCDETPADPQIFPEGDLVQISSPKVQTHIANSYLPSNATGTSCEVTQQASEQHEQIPADTHPKIPHNANLGFNTLDLNHHANSSAHRIQATGQPWEVTQQTSVPHGTTPADQQLTEGNNSNGIKLGELTSNSQEIISTIQATGQPWEVTQQTSVPHGTTPADQQLTEGNNANGIKLSELTSNSQEIISTIQATGQPWEVTQQTFAQHGQVSADDQRLNEGNTSTGIKNLLHEFNPAVMIPAGNTTQIYPKPTGNYPQQILKQAYGSSKNFLHEFNPAVMIAAVTPPPIHPKPI